MSSVVGPRAAAPRTAQFSAHDAFVREAVFDRFMHGLLIADGDGRIICGNGAAARLLAQSGLSISDTDCCALLECGDGGCLARLAAAGTPVADVRRDLQTEAGPVAVWLSAAMVTDEPKRILIQLRSGDVKDRRRRIEPGWNTVETLRVTTLGRTTVTCGPVTMEGGWLDQRTGDLLRYLVVRRGRTVTADEIGESVWRSPGYDVARNVRTCVHRLRAALEPGRARHASSAYLLTRGCSYRLNPDHVQVDVDDFERLLTRGAALAEVDPAAAVRELEAALGLYGGEFFSEVPFADWALTERARLHDMACGGLHRLAALHRESGCAGAAREALERLSGLQPLDEGVCRELIELDMSCGRHSDAKRRYDALSHMMRSSLGYGPRFTLADAAVVIEM